MSLRLILRKIAACFRRDLAIARTYRAAFALEALEALLGVATFFYLSRFVQSEELSRMLPAGTNYFAFVLVGIAFFDYLYVAFEAFDASLQEARRNGTLEALLVTETSLPVLLAGSAIYPFTSMTLRTALYFVWGLAFFGFPAGLANWPGAILVLLVSILSFAGLGILSAAYVLLFKRGNPAKWALLGLSSLVSGMMYPVSVLPDSLQVVARLIPVTYSLEAMRAALLSGASFVQLWPAIRALLMFAVVLLPLSFAVFGWALRRTKINGTLTHF